MKAIPISLAARSFPSEVPYDDNFHWKYKLGARGENGFVFQLGFGHCVSHLPLSRYLDHPRVRNHRDKVRYLRLSPSSMASLRDDPIVAEPAPEERPRVAAAWAAAAPFVIPLIISVVAVEDLNA